MCAVFVAAAVLSMLPRGTAESRPFLRWGGAAMTALAASDIGYTGAALGVWPDAGIWSAAVSQVGLALLVPVELGAARRCWTERTGTGLDLDVGVNLSPRQLTDDVVDTVRRALQEHAVPPHRLVLEITEESLLDDWDLAVHALDGLPAMGVVTAVDDVGTGWSSRRRLRRFTLDVIEVDQGVRGRPHRRAAHQPAGHQRGRHGGPAGAGLRRGGDRDAGAVGRGDGGRLPVRAGLPARPADAVRGRARAARARTGRSRPADGAARLAARRPVGQLRVH